MDYLHAVAISMTKQAHCQFLLLRNDLRVTGQNVPNDLQCVVPLNVMLGYILGKNHLYVIGKDVDKVLHNVIHLLFIEELILAKNLMYVNVGNDLDNLVVLADTKKLILVRRDRVKSFNFSQLTYQQRP